MNTGGEGDDGGEEMNGVPWLVIPDAQGVPFPVSEELQQIMGSEEYQKNEEQFSLLYERLVTYIDEKGLEDMLYAERDMESIYLRVAAGILFQSGRADIREEAEPILDTLEDIFFTAGDSLSMVTIEGHTDNVPIRNARYEDNWELSSDRATRVGRYIWEKGRISQDKFSVSGYGEFRPIDTNETEEGKQANRRVEFVLRKKVLTMEDIQGVDEEGEPPKVDVSADPSKAADVMPDAAP